MSPNARGALIALIAFGIFSTHDVIIKVLGGVYSPIQIVFFSVLLSLLMLSIKRSISAFDTLTRLRKRRSIIF